MRIAFRTDASAQIGTGHKVRCSNLAAASGAEVRFVCRHLVGDTGWPTVRLPVRASSPAPGYGAWLGVSQDEDARDTIAALQDFAPDWVVVDHYALDAVWERAIRQALGCRIFVIDDLANRSHDCDALLDQNFHERPVERYAPYLGEEAHRFFGPRYALLKPEFFAPQQSERRHAAPQHIFVFFGGIDATGETLRSLRVLADMPEAQSAQMDVVCGGANPQLAEIRTLCAAQGHALHVDTPDMATLIARADFGIAGGGVNTWERCYLGLPTLVLTVAENQEPSMRACAGAGLIAYAGRAQDLTAQALRDAIAAFLTDAAGRARIEAACRSYFTQSGLGEIRALLASASE